MGANNYNELRRHIGHKIVCVHYDNPSWKFDDSKPICANVSIECETCNEVLMDYDREDDDR